MVTVLWNPLRRWWQTAFQAPAPAAIPALVFRQPAFRARPASAVAPRPRPVTPFRAPLPLARAVGIDGTRRAARRFWMTLDPEDRRRAAIGGSFAEVCAALESLAALEERRV